jgi:hypothetical protein
MIPSKTTALLGQIRRDLAEIQDLRQEIRRAPDQVSRDNAIIRHTRTLDKIIDALQQLEDAGILDALWQNLRRPPKPHQPCSRNSKSSGARENTSSAPGTKPGKKLNGG